MKTTRRKGSDWSLETLEPGRVIEFDYPAVNRYGFDLEYVRRKVRVEKVQDLRQSPLRPADFLVDPFKRRGLFLITGEDVDLGAGRQYYVEAMRRRGPLPFLRLGLIDPEEPTDLVEWIAEPFAPCLAEMRTMVDVVRHYQVWASAEDIALELAVFVYGIHSSAPASAAVRPM